MECIAYIDGGRVPGTKLTTIGGFIVRDGVEVARYSEIGGEGSNTDAEWQSAIRCMTLALNLQISSLHLRTDARVIADMLTTNHEVLRSMIDGLDRNPGNAGLRKAIGIRVNQRFSGVREMKNWLAANRNVLEASTGCPARYQNEITALTTRLHLSVELIPREANSLADELCHRARGRTRSKPRGVQQS